MSLCCPVIFIAFVASVGETVVSYKIMNSYLFLIRFNTIPCDIFNIQDEGFCCII